MASQITHILAGERALARAMPDSREILRVHGTWFRLGCQGPDLFYHNQRTRPLALHYGSLAHRRGYGALVEGMASAARDRPDDGAWAAFTLGFATHAAVDRATHPYIVLKSGWPDPARPETAAYRGCHPFLERVLDTLLWERRTGRPVREFRQAEALVPPGGTPRRFAERMAAALRSAYPGHAEEDQVLVQRLANAFEDSEFLYLHTDPSMTATAGADEAGSRYLDDDSGPRSVSILYPEDLGRATDWANEAREPWVHPCDPPREYRSSYYELVEEAESAAAAALAATAAALGEAGTEAGALAAAVGDGTLNVGDDAGIQGPPRRMDPLPLPELMAREYRMRLNRLKRAERSGNP